MVCALRSFQSWQVQQLPGHSAPVTSLLLVASGQTLYSGSLDKDIRVWVNAMRPLGAAREDAAAKATQAACDFQCVHVIRTAHSKPITSMCLGSTEQVLYSASEDCKIKVWLMVQHQPGDGKSLAVTESSGCPGYKGLLWDDDCTNHISTHGPVSQMAHCARTGKVFCTVEDGKPCVYTHHSDRKEARKKGSGGREEQAGESAGPSGQRTVPEPTPVPTNGMPSGWWASRIWGAKGAAQRAAEAVAGARAGSASASQMQWETPGDVFQVLLEMQRKERRLQECSHRTQELSAEDGAYPAPVSVADACKVLGFSNWEVDSTTGKPPRKKVIKLYASKRARADKKQQEMEQIALLLRVNVSFAGEGCMQKLAAEMDSETENAIISAAAHIRAEQLQLTDAYKILN
eukprot:gene1801-2469_t